MSVRFAQIECNSGAVTDIAGPWAPAARSGGTSRWWRRPSARDSRPVAKRKIARQLRGQLMLQVAAGRFFRPDVPLNETEHRYTVYSNAWFIGAPRYRSAK